MERRRKISRVELGKMLKTRRGKDAEMLVQLRFSTLGIDSRRCPENMKYKDMDVWDPKNGVKVPVQVKSSSLKKHGAAIRVDAEPLKVFEGWYVILIEQEPEDIYLYVPSGEMKKLMGEYGEDDKEYGKVRHHKGRRYIDVCPNWGVLQRFSDPEEFIKTVHEAGRPQGRD